MLTNRRVIGLLERLELAAYAAADQVVVVSEGFRADLIRRGVPPAKVHTIRNGVDAGAVRRRGRRPGVTGARTARRRRRRLPGALRGDARDLAGACPAIADAAALVAARAPGGASVRFAFVGDGADKRRLERRVAELGLRNTVLLPGVPQRARCPGCSRRRTSAWCRCATCRCSRRSSRRRCSSTWPRARRSSARWPGRRRRSCAEAGARRGAAGGQRRARRRDRRARRRPGAARGDGAGRPGLRRAALRPGGAGQGVPEDPRPGTGVRADEAPGDRRERVPRRVRPRRGRPPRA